MQQHKPLTFYDCHTLTAAFVLLNEANPRQLTLKDAPTRPFNNTKALLTHLEGAARLALFDKRVLFP